MEDKRESLSERTGYECVNWVKLAEDTFQWQDDKYKYQPTAELSRRLHHDSSGRQLSSSPSNILLAEASFVLPSVSSRSCRRGAQLGSFIEAMRIGAVLGNATGSCLP
jgi:hypothetical protein